jgi:hypothetical protein
MLGLRHQRDIKSFLAFLPLMRVFHLLMLSLLIGLGIAAWLVVRVTQATLGGLLFSLIHTFVVGFAIILYFCYRAYDVETPEPANQRTIVHRRITIRRELVAAIPLFLGSIAGIYFVTTHQLTHILVVSFLSLILWTFIRFLLGVKQQGSR